MLDMSRPAVPEVATHIRELLVTGQLTAPEFVRLEPIAKTLGVSTTPVREALRQLTAEGFVHFLPHRGFQVAPLTADDLRDVYLVQAFVAGELAARAARALSPNQVDTLEDIQSRLEDASHHREYEQVEECNHEFHRLLNRAAASPRLAATLAATTQFAPRRFFASIPGWTQASANDHRAIILALRNTDAESARVAMAAHIRRAGHLLADHRQRDTEGTR